MSDRIKVQITARITPEAVEEIEEIASHLFANKTAIIQECLTLGLEEFKKRRPDIVKLVESRRKNLEFNKKGDHRRSA